MLSCKPTNAYQVIQNKYFGTIPKTKVTFVVPAKAGIQEFT